MYFFLFSLVNIVFSGFVTFLITARYEKRLTILQEKSKFFEEWLSNHDKMLANCGQHLCNHDQMIDIIAKEIGCSFEDNEE